MSGHMLRATKLRIQGRDLALGAALVAAAFASSVAAGVVGSFFGSDLSLGDIQGWSFSLGQVSFGLGAAFLALIVAQLGEFRGWWHQWKDRVSEKLPPVPDDWIEALDKLGDHARAKGSLDDADVRYLKRKLEMSLLYLPDKRMEYFLPALQKIQHLLTQEATWKNLAKDAGVSAILDDRFRAQSIAEAFTCSLSYHHARLIIFTFSLWAVTLLLGILSLSPDPFFYGTALSLYAGLDPDFSEVNYKMFALVFPAIVMMGWMTFLGYKVGLAFSELNKLRPDQFDKTLWQYRLP